MVKKIKEVAKLWKRGICTTEEACKKIVDIYEDYAYLDVLPITLEGAEEVLTEFATLV